MNNLNHNPGSDMQSAAVVLVNFNSAEYLTMAVGSLLNDESVREIVVVDNGSQDASLDILRQKVSDNRIRIIETRENLGFARAVNIGANNLASSYLVLVNPDCLLDPGAVSELIRRANDLPEAGVVGALVVNPDGTEQRGCRRRLPTPVSGLGESVLFRWLLTGFNQTGEPLPDRPVRVEAVSGAFMAIKADVFRRLRGMDEGYFLHFEDIDICARAAAAGYGVWFVPQARAVHEKGVSSRSRPLFVEWHKHRGMWRFFRQHYPPCRHAWVRWLVWCGVSSRFAGIALMASPRIFSMWLRRVAGTAT
ncbi:MAG TPA: glycosyltransferase family 2 protein [Gammaproteobacteria bacterium]|nr:glycosyltransferase family 2 protein [Gammaproteobacteria bacterium]